MLSLSKDGITFDNAFTNFPVCSPSRSSFMTGLYPDTLKIYTFFEKVDKELTIPKFLKSQSYETASFGKVFHGPLYKGYDIYADHWTYKPTGVSANAYVDNANSQCPNQQVVCTIEESKAPDTKVANAAITFIESRKKSSKPWYVAVGFFRPHLNLAVPARFLKKANPAPANITLLVDQTNLNYFECDDLQVKTMEFSGHLEKIVDPARGRPTSLIFSQKFKQNALLIRKYYEAAVLHVDYEMGRIMDKLKALGVYNSTLIIFHSDHGFATGHYGMWCKNALLDAQTKVPLVIKPPSGTVIKDTKKLPISLPYRTPIIVQLIDVFPTMLHFMDVPKVMDSLDGIDLFDWIGSTFSVARLAYARYPRCLPKGQLQDNNCMYGTPPNFCSSFTQPIYMGTAVRIMENNDVTTYISWNPFQYEMAKCDVMFPTSKDTFPFIDKDKSKTSFHKGPYDVLVLINGTVQFETDKKRIDEVIAITENELQ